MISRNSLTLLRNLTQINKSIVNKVIEISTEVKGNVKVYRFLWNKAADVYYKQEQQPQIKVVDSCQ